MVRPESGCGQDMYNHVYSIMTLYRVTPALELAGTSECFLQWVREAAKGYKQVHRKGKHIQLHVYLFLGFPMEGEDRVSYKKYSHAPIFVPMHVRQQEFTIR